MLKRPLGGAEVGGGVFLSHNSKEKYGQHSCTTFNLVILVNSDNTANTGDYMQTYICHVHVYIIRTYKCVYSMYSPAHEHVDLLNNLFGE